MLSGPSGIHNLYVRRGLVKSPRGRMYDVRIHSLRKYAKTQMIAAGIAESYADYFLGHKTDTYNDIQSLGVEKLRTIYASASLAIRPKTTASRLEQLREMARAIDEQIRVLGREGSSEPARVEISGQSQQIQVRQLLASAIKDLIRQEEGTVGLNSR